MRQRLCDKATRCTAKDPCQEMERMVMRGESYLWIGGTAKESERHAYRLLLRRDCPAEPDCGAEFDSQEGKVHSGVLVITGFMGPGNSLPKDCHYCPTNQAWPAIPLKSLGLVGSATVGSTRSDRASVGNNGHVVDKIELISWAARSPSPEAVWEDLRERPSTRPTRTTTRAPPNAPCRRSH